MREMRNYTKTTLKLHFRLQNYTDLGRNYTKKVTGEGRVMMSPQKPRTISVSTALNILNPFGRTRFGGLPEVSHGGQSAVIPGVAPLNRVEDVQRALAERRSQRDR